MAAVRSNAAIRLNRRFPTDAGRYESLGMRKEVIVDVNAADRARLEAIVADRNSPQKHVWWARIILLTAAGLGMVAIMRRTGKSKTCVWRWQERFMTAGVDGLPREKTRPFRRPLSLSRRLRAEKGA